MTQYGEQYWNSKWKVGSAIYKGRALRGKSDEIPVDVKNFITVNDDMLKSIVSKYGLKKATMNQTANACQLFVVQHLTYKGDDEENQCPEFWQFPFETLDSQIGDCEDGAIFMASLMITAGIPSWRVKVCAGLVQPEPTAEQGGHAYCIFLADRNDVPEKLAWEIHDWCYYEDSKIPTGSKPLAKDGGYKGTYKSVWFTFNNQFAWADGPIEVGQKRIKVGA